LEKISVLIPAYKPSKKEKKLIESNKKILEDDKRIKEIIINNVKGFANARIDLLSKANYNLLLWIDADIELLENPLDIFISKMKKDTKTVGVCGTSELCGNDWKIYMFQATIKSIEDYLPNDYDAWEKIFECSLFKKKPLEDLGFDVNFNCGGEDDDIMYRLNEKGFKIIRTKDVKVMHHYRTKNFWKKMSAYRKGTEKLLDKYGFINKPTLNINMFQISKQFIINLFKMGKPHYLFLYPIWKFKRMRC